MAGRYLALTGEDVRPCGIEDDPPLWSRAKTKAFWRAYRAQRHALSLPRHGGPRSPRRAKP